MGLAEKPFAGAMDELAPGDDWKIRLSDRLGAETLEAEQALCGTQPGHLDNFLERALRRLSPGHRHQGNLEEKYQASRGEVFEVPSFLVPLDEKTKHLGDGTAFEES